MFNKILLAVGTGQESREPARVAGLLAAELHAELVIVNVRHDPPGVLGEPFYSDSLDRRLEDSNETLEAARRIAEEQGAVVARVESLEGVAPARILSMAEIDEFTLIVVGTRGRNRLESALLGSVSAAVAARSQLPVLVVPSTVAQEANQPPLAYAAG